MINKNLEFIKYHSNDSHWQTSIEGQEINELINKHGNVLNVKINKPEEPGTENQNRAMHALLKEYYITGLHSAPEGCTLEKFKLYVKIQHGICTDFEYQGKQIRVPKSWADYSKRERMEFINSLISEINQSGAYVESENIREIISGMELGAKIP